MKEDPKDPKAKKEYLIEKGMEAYIAAIGKVAKAEEAFLASTATFKSCADFGEALTHFYYWKYRLERLRYYHDVVYGFCQEVEKQVETIAANVKQVEDKIAADWPKYLFENPEWHNTMCRNTVCSYPWHKAEISGPYNVVHHPGFITPGKNASLNPVPVVPTKAAPPLPPRNPQQIADFLKKNPR